MKRGKSNRGRVVYELGCEGLLAPCNHAKLMIIHNVCALVRGSCSLASLGREPCKLIAIAYNHVCLFSYLLPCFGCYNCRFHAALEQSVERHFPGNHCINCMCHSTENIYR